jgi:hypothetical protein
MRFKTVALQAAYQDGLRRCPCCNVQLVWRANTENLQNNLATVDHIIPKSIGGADTSDNMFIMCRKCNTLRDTQCFVKFVSDRGVSKSLAEDVYKKAHVATLQSMIYVQFTQNILERDVARKTNKKRRNHIRNVIKSYSDYFGDYLPEFQLLQRLVT